MIKNPWLEIIVPQEQICARRIDSSHPLDFFWGRDVFGHKLLILESPLGLIQHAIPRIKGIEIKKFVDSNVGRLIFELKVNSEWEIFLTLCQDLVNSTSSVLSPDQGIAVIVRRLERWRDFLQTAREGLSEQEIKGLIGELVFLKNHLGPQVGFCNAVMAWQGPKGFPHDFCVDKMVFEIKCTSGSKQSLIHINSAEQLTSPPNMCLWLYVLKVNPCSNPEDALNLPSLVEEIKGLLEGSCLEKFNDLLMNVGYFYLERYEQINFTILDDAFYEVKGDFPRLTQLDLIKGITNLSYCIDLNECEDYRNSNYPGAI